MSLRQRYRGSLPADLHRISSAPLLDEWLLEPDDQAADGAVLTGVISGHPRYPDGTRVTTSTVQQIEDEPANGIGRWAWSYSTGLLRLGTCIDLPYSRGVPL
ncbi:hypothetical protein GOFOIKOB_0377 [Methylobacterium tardum]|jgi:hypothetical protein|uniref:Uncharacterized protein n=1 Tax=Methylobacterium tardum TaxID=374432 RepID=A0AA37TCN5_9HYPH|nr:hypothetical protein [Methylobacterium tardum]URD36914.1 hypothetical protein M6G65_32250 [Methylobacterium tardum]GJE47356.1 hypothetical protein GOFOIKOB_0377 [Methylobacterium tardum]GLS71271.1 hypothetical protein GCM10007890_32840 [Methylobacterium tardum]